MDYLKMARDVLKMEAQALELAGSRLTEAQINKLLGLYAKLREVGGQLVFTGVGKSGIVGMKLASTFSSLGLPSFFLHPVEAMHGDLGRFRASDALVILSKSGNTEEVMRLLPYLEIQKDMVMGLLGEVHSPLAERCGLVLDCSVEKEACINNQAPTTSSTLALAMGDAMAVVYEAYVGLSKEKFAVNHPGGLLGKTLRLRVRDLMTASGDCPTVDSKATLQDVILAMTNRPLGGCAVLGADGKMEGIIVEGDIRRAFAKKGQDLSTPAGNIMCATPVSIGPEELAFEALKVMEQRERPIAVLPVLGEGGRFLGIIRLHDLLREGLVSRKK